MALKVSNRRNKLSTALREWAKLEGVNKDVVGNNNKISAGNVESHSVHHSGRRGNLLIESRSTQLVVCLSRSLLSNSLAMPIL